MNIEFTPHRQLGNSIGSPNTNFNYGEGTSRSLNSNLTNVNSSINGGVNGDTSMQGTQNRPSVSFAEKIHFFTGTAERVLAWNRVFKQRCYFEVIASVISIQDSQDDKQTILLKDKKGPILQVIRYLNHELNEMNFTVGQVLRCVGYMNGINVMVAVNVRKATADEIASLKRYCYIGDFTISGFINAEDNR